MMTDNMEFGGREGKKKWSNLKQISFVAFTWEENLNGSR